MALPVVNQDDEATEKLNKLLIKCIDSRNKLAYVDFKTLEEKERPFKEKLIEKYHELSSLSVGKPSVNVDVYIEECYDNDGPFQLCCYPKWTIRTLKFIIIEKFRRDSLFENIYVLCRNNIAQEWDTLEQCGVQQDGDILYIYIEREKSFQQPSLNSSKEDLLTDQEMPILEQVNSNEDRYDQDVDAVALNNTIATEPNTNNNQTTFEPLTPIVDDETVVTPIVDDETGWTCKKCTVINEPTRPGCVVCSDPRPDNYQPPEGYIPSPSEQIRIEEEKKADEMANKLRHDKLLRKEEKRKLNYERHKIAVQQNLTISKNAIDCSICLTETEPGDAVVLAGCLHTFCKECISQHIMLNEGVMIKCPFVADNHSCGSYLEEREIRSLLPKDKFEKYLTKSLETASKLTSNSFHCQTADCHGWCEYDDGVNVFHCPVCNHTNCLTCKAVHEQQNCREYQDELFKSGDGSVRKTRMMLQQLVKQNDAMHCPRCNIIILKKEGCDWLRCSMCQLEICWVTKGPRWGPNGAGDTSSGCRCRVNDKKCHPKCLNCH